MQRPRCSILSGIMAANRSAARLGSMRFLGVSETCDLGALYLRLQAEGHEVKLAVSEPLAEGTLAGLVPRVPDWQSGLDWIEEAGDRGIILFEAVSDGFGALQDDLRRRGFRVIGGSAF